MAERVFQVLPNMPNAQRTTSRALSCGLGAHLCVSDALPVFSTALYRSSQLEAPTVSTRNSTETNDARTDRRDCAVRNEGRRGSRGLPTAAQRAASGEAEKHEPSRPARLGSKGTRKAHSEAEGSQELLSRQAAGGAAGSVVPAATTGHLIINTPTLQPRLRVVFAEDQSGTAPPSIRASHEGLELQPVISETQRGTSTPAVSQRFAPGPVRVGGPLSLQLVATSSSRTEVRHAASGEMPGLRIAGSRSKQTFKNGAHGGHIWVREEWVERGGAGPAARMRRALYEFAKPVHGGGSSGGESAAEDAVAQPGSAPGFREVVGSNPISVSPKIGKSLAGDRASDHHTEGAVARTAALSVAGTIQGRAA